LRRRYVGVVGRDGLFSAGYFEAFYALISFQHQNL